MRRLISLILALLMVISLEVAAEEGENSILYPIEADYRVGVSVTKECARGLGKGTYLGFDGVDLTGINSITMECEFIMPSGCNGETVRVMLDDPVNGSQIASIVIYTDEVTCFDAYVEPTNGVHTLYFVGNYYNSLPDNFKIKSFTLKKEEYKDSAIEEQVPDSIIKDYCFDTWTSVDDMGRKVADFSEVGAPKKDRTVGMLAWNWHSNAGVSNARVISDILKKYPDAMDNSDSVAWADSATHFWGEPIYGFYGSAEYWVCRNQIELMAAAGVDAFFFDWSNGGTMFVKSTNQYVKALRDLKKEGVNVPKMCAFPSNINNAQEDNLLLAALYNIGWVKNDWSDIWFYWEGKPLIFGFPNAKHIKDYYNPYDEAGRAMCDEINDFFTWRAQQANSTKGWSWLEAFPQYLRNTDLTNDKRPEFMSVGMALNQSYIYLDKSYAFSEPYTMSKSYSMGFGDDISPEGVRKGWQFRDQARQALEADPHFVMVDGWNEYTAIRYAMFNGLDNVFVDTFDDNNSRDFEPTKGELKDDYYNLLVDFIRKYKGAKPAPLAGEAKTIAVGGDLAQWDSVTPAFYNASGVNRNSDSGYKNPETGKVWHYETSNTADRVTFSKVSRDNDNFYFLAKTKEGQDIKNAAIYINIDRNKATGFEGYDFAIGRANTAAVEKINNDGSYTYLGEAVVSKNANAVQMAVLKAILGETGTADFEFKWITGTFTDVLSLYSEANAAPIGRFNYLYTEIPQRALTEAERTLAKGSAIYKAGSDKMIVSGGIVNVYEPDTTVTPFEMYNTLYIPAEAVEEYLGYGRGRVEYVASNNNFYMYTYEMNEDLTKISRKDWYYTYAGSLEGRVNGVLHTLTAPVVSGNGKIYVPISIFSDLMGKEVKNLGNGAYAVGNIDTQSATNLLGYIG